MVKIVWSELAIDDLKSIHNFISKDSKTYADRHVIKILDSVKRLENYPKSGRIVPEFEEESLREIIMGNYRIVYRIRNNLVGVSRIHHSSRLIKKLIHPPL